MRVRVGRAALILGAMALVAWVRSQPLAEARDAVTFTGGDGRVHRYLVGYDSYDWLRMARTLLRTGSPCDAGPPGECRDAMTLAPVGAPIPYPHSPHVYAIAGLHRLFALWQPGVPLSSSAALVSILLAALGVVPAAAIGRRLAGHAGGLAAAIAVGVSPVFVYRSAGADNDAWHVVLSLAAVWAAAAAARADRAWRRGALAAATLAALGLQALAWRGWLFTAAVVVAGLVAAALLLGVAARLAGRRAPWRRAPLRGVLLTVLLIGGLPALLMPFAGVTRETARDLQRAAVTAVSPPAVASDGFPQAIATVSELRRPPLQEIARLLGGPAPFVAAWLGILLLFLPRRAWQPRHFAVLIGGTLLGWFLLTTVNPGRAALLALIGPALVAAALLRARDADAVDDPAWPLALLVAVWFSAALFAAFDGLRFALLLAAPAGIAFGVAVGRLAEWAARTVPASAPRAARAALPLAIAAAALILPVRRGLEAGRAAQPRLNDAWWAALTAVRERTPADAVLHVWWPYGFFSKYVAERAVSVDGAALATHAPVWLARALMAEDEPLALGVLRMLGCGSDASPRSERHAGAFYRLLVSGQNAAGAQAAIRTLIGLDARAARRHLARIHASAAVLEATHCQPPPTYLLLTSELALSSAWRSLGVWPSDGAAPGEEALFTPEWVACQPSPFGTERTCPLRLALGGGRTAEAFTYAVAAPEVGALRWRGADGASHSGPPPTTVVAGPQGLVARTAGPTAERLDGRLSILVDPDHDRILVGTPGMLRSTFVGLQFLDGRYTPHFRKFDEQTVPGERVTTWQVEW